MNQKPLLLTLLLIISLTLCYCFAIAADRTTRQETISATSEKLDTSRIQKPTSNKKDPAKLRQVDKSQKAKTRFGFCCKDGKYSSSSQAKCKKLRGTYFDTERNARTKCTGFCCTDGTVNKTTEASCKKKRGMFFGRQSDAEKRCAQDRGFCCKNSVISKSTINKCKKDNGSFYRSKRIAKDKCKGYCCIKAKIRQLTKRQCLAKKGKFYNSQRVAAKECKETTGYCNTIEKTLRITKKECNKKKGIYFTSPILAKKALIKAKRLAIAKDQSKRAKNIKKLPPFKKPPTPLPFIDKRTSDSDKDTALPSTTTSPKIQSAPRAIRITRPELGDFMVENGQFVLRWSGIGNIEENCVNIQLLHKGNFQMSIAQNVCINGFNWQLPPGISGTGYKIRIKTIDNALTDNSDPFSILSARPDLTITNLHIQPAAPDMQDVITVTGVITNSGHGTSVKTKAIIRLETSARSREETLSIPSLVFGPNAHHPFSISFDPLATTELTASVEVDPQNIVTEANEENNSKQITFPVIRLPNLKVCVNDEIYNSLGRMNIPILIKNYSFEPIGPTICRTWINNHGYQEHDVPALGPFENITIFRDAKFKVTGWRSYSATVDYYGTSREAFETDNVATGRIHIVGIGAHPMPWPQCD